MNCLECGDKGRFWTEGSPKSCREAGCFVIETPHLEFDGTTLIECPLCSTKAYLKDLLEVIEGKEFIPNGLNRNQIVEVLKEMLATGKKAYTIATERG